MRRILREMTVAFLAMAALLSLFVGRSCGAELVAVTRAEWNSFRLEITYDAPPTLADLQQTVLFAPGTEYPVLWAERANVAGNVAVAYCSWPADQPHHIVAEKGALRVCGTWGAPDSPSPCAEVEGAAYYVTRTLNAADVGSFARLFRTGEVVEIRAAADSTLLAIEYTLNGAAPEVWVRYLPQVFHDCASDSLMLVYSPQAAAALRQGCEE